MDPTEYNMSLPCHRFDSRPFFFLFTFRKPPFHQTPNTSDSKNLTLPFHLSHILATMIGVQDSMTLILLLNSDQRPFDEIFVDFFSKFMRESHFRVCCSIATLLEASPKSLSVSVSTCSLEFSFGWDFGVLIRFWNIECFLQA